MIKPTVGRVILVRNRPGNRVPTRAEDHPHGEEAGIIAYVHNDRLINVACFTNWGQHAPLVNIRLLQPGDEVPKNEVYAEWMPFQKGQAGRAEQLAARLEELSRGGVDSAKSNPRGATAGPGGSTSQE